MLVLNIDYQQDSLYATLFGKLTKKTTYKFHQYVIPYTKQKCIKKFVIDCENLKKIDMEGKYTLLKLKLILKKQKGSLVLCNVKEDVKKELIGYRMRIQS